MAEKNCMPKEGGAAPTIKDTGTAFAKNGAEYGVKGADLERGFSGGGALGKPEMRKNNCTCGAGECCS